MGDDGADWVPGYEGERDEKGKRHGQGVATHKNGDVYTGGYKHGLRHGKGSYVFKAGGKYEGGYHRNKKDGMGVMTYADGSVYRGEWTADKRNGTGTYTYANGDTYDGGWKEGGRHGKGTYFFAQHSCQFFGYWNTGSFAWGTWVFKDGTTFAGKFSDGPTQPRPASRAPGAFYAANLQQAGQIKAGRWAPNMQMVPAGSATKAPVRLHMRCQLAFVFRRRRRDAAEHPARHHGLAGDRAHG